MKYPMSNIPHPDCPENRVVGFRLKSTDEAHGKYGLSEPLFWLEKLVKDAERYRWLCAAGEGCPNHPFRVLNEFDSTKEDIDSAIDSAMGGEK